MNNLILNSQILASGTSSNTDALIDNIVYCYLLPFFLILWTLVFAFKLLFYTFSRPQNQTMLPTSYIKNLTSVKTISTKPVIAYKKAKITFDNIDKKSNIINIHFHGVSGNVRYELIEDHCQESHGFHMYKDINDAFKHDQYGNVILEVLAYGDVKEYEKGYITTGQRVLQIIMDKKTSWENAAISDFLICNKIGLSDLYKTNWTDSDGNEIVFAPCENYSYTKRMKKYMIPAYSPTQLKDDNKLQVESN